MGLLKSLVDTEYKELKKFKKIADKIIELDDKYTNMSDEDLASTTEKLKAQLEAGKTVNDEDIIALVLVA